MNFCGRVESWGLTGVLRPSLDGLCMCEVMGGLAVSQSFFCRSWWDVFKLEGLSSLMALVFMRGSFLRWRKLKKSLVASREGGAEGFLS